MRCISIGQHCSKDRELEQTLLVPHPPPLGIHLPMKGAFCNYLQLSDWGLCSHPGSCSAHMLDKLEAPWRVNAPGSSSHTSMGREFGVKCHHFLALSWDSVRQVLYYSQGIQLWQFPVPSVLTMPPFWASLPVFLGIKSGINYLHLNVCLWRNPNQEIKDQEAPV